MKNSESMRAVFASAMHAEMENNKNIYIITNDLGYRMWDRIREDFPERFINVGAAEQTLIGVSVGLALSGKIPIAYSITSFLLYRPFETIRNYIDHERIPVKLIGSGRDKDYSHDGFSHWSEEDKEIMKIFKNIKALWPSNNEVVPSIVKKIVTTEKPFYVNLRRK